MSEEIKSIHEFDLDMICEYYSAVDRQGPGSEEITLKALNFVEGLTDNSRIVDLGCGTGGQGCISRNQYNPQQCCYYTKSRICSCCFFHSSGVLLD